MLPPPAQDAGCGSGFGQVRVYRSLAGPLETVVLADAPALDLIPEWNPAQLAAAFGEVCAELRGIWRYARYRRASA